MRGFVVGSLALVVGYVLLQPGAAGKISTGGGLLAGGLRRLLSPTVAGIPQRGGVTKSGPQPTGAAPASSSVLPSFVTV
jgi:hypothetical protein